MCRIVWIPRHRRRTLVGQVAEQLKQTVEQSAAEREWDVVALEVMPGHVHLFVASPPAVRPSDFKGVSARILLKEFLGLAQRPGRGALWAHSYLIATSGNVSAETIERHIREQTEGG